MLDTVRIRKDFPILQQKINDYPVIYFDTAATAQKPKMVSDAIYKFYCEENASVHRSIHQLGEVVTENYEKARICVSNFINAKKDKEIVFTRNTTEAINLLANVFVKKHCKSGDEIIISAMEHHSNIVPWQLLAESSGINLVVIPISKVGELLLDEYKKLFSAKTKLVSIVHTSNTLGTINPVKEIIEIAHQHKVPVLLDAAQAVTHQKIDVQDLDCDFLAFSGHKLYGPTGIGVLYGKEELLSELGPYQGGGSMIETVSFEKSTFADIPQRFEAGTPHIAGVMGIKAAIEYVEEIGMHNIAQHEQQLLEYATRLLLQVPGLRIIGNAKTKAAIISFVMDKIHPHDISSYLNHYGICIRAGHHCTMPLMEFFNIPATARVSFAVYNTTEEIDFLYKKLVEMCRFFKV
ncbi:MAG: cysteine desulfurase CsdA [Thiotrichales bacterium]|nr:MAG: cysteine desulfurase CsdA [Thiotrichales bacterium]